MTGNRTDNFHTAYATVVFVFIIAWWSLLVTGSSIASAGDKDLADIPMQRWDFGYLPQKVNASHTFFVVNTDTVPLAVSKIKAGCSCTSVSKIDRPIPPGDSAEVTVTLKSGRYHKGIKKTTKIYGEDKDTPVYLLQITAYVVKNGDDTGPVRCLPNKLEYKMPPTGEVIVDTVLLVNTGTTPVNIDIRHHPGPWATIAVPDSIPSGDTTACVVTVEPELQEAISPSFTLGISGNDTTVITLPLKIKK
jgi:hypothetical protein